MPEAVTVALGQIFAAGREGPLAMAVDPGLRVMAAMMETDAPRRAA